MADAMTRTPLELAGATIEDLEGKERRLGEVIAVAGAPVVLVFIRHFG